MLTGKPTRRRFLGGPRRRWKVNIKIDVKEIGANTRNWINSVQDRARRPSDEGCATSHPLEWGPLPSSKVGRIAQHVRKKDGRKLEKEGQGINPKKYLICVLIIIASESIYYYNYFRRFFVFIIVILILVCIFRRIRLFTFYLFFERD